MSQDWTPISYNFFKILLSSSVPNLRNVDCFMSLLVNQYPRINDFLSTVNESSSNAIVNIIIRCNNNPTNPPLSFNRDLPSTWDDTLSNDFKNLLLTLSNSTPSPDLLCGIENLKKQYPNPTDALTYFVSDSVRNSPTDPPFFRCIPTLTPTSFPTLTSFSTLTPTSNKQSNIPIIVGGIGLFIFGVCIILFLLSKLKKKGSRINILND